MMIIFLSGGLRDLFLIPQASSSPLLILTCALLMNNISLSRSGDHGAMGLVGFCQTNNFAVFNVFAFAKVLLILNTFYH